MIALLSGTIASRDGDTLVLLTDGGVGYDVAVPAQTAARLPDPGHRVVLHTELVVREDEWLLFGFERPVEREIFRRLRGASGFGPRLALALLSALGPEGTVRSIQGRDLAALSSVSGIGRKKAERLVLELNDKFGDVAVTPLAPRPPGTDDAVLALVGLGYPAAAAESAVRAALAAGAPEDPAPLIRRALQQLAPTRGGR
jgi:Holliday junction DNA helicase RuvA